MMDPSSVVQDVTSKTTMTECLVLTKTTPGDVEVVVAEALEVIAEEEEALVEAVATAMTTVEDTVAVVVTVTEEAMVAAVVTAMNEEGATIAGVETMVVPGDAVAVALVTVVATKIAEVAVALVTAEVGLMIAVEAVALMIVGVAVVLATVVEAHLQQNVHDCNSRDAQLQSQHQNQ